MSPAAGADLEEAVPQLPPACLPACLSVNQCVCLSLPLPD